MSHTRTLAFQNPNKMGKMAGEEAIHPISNRAYHSRHLISNKGETMHTVGRTSISSPRKTFACSPPVSSPISFLPTCLLLLPWQASSTSNVGSEAAEKQSLGLQCSCPTPEASSKSACRAPSFIWKRWAWVWKAWGVFLSHLVVVDAVYAMDDTLDGACSLTRIDTDTETDTDTDTDTDTHTDTHGCCI